MQQRLDDSIETPRFNMTLLGNFRVARAGPRHDRRLRRNFLFRRAAHSRNWYSRGSRRGTFGYSAPGPWAGRRDGSHRPRARCGRLAASHTLPRQSPQRRSARRSRDDHFRGTVAHLRRASGLLHSAAPPQSIPSSPCATNSFSNAHLGARFDANSPGRVEKTCTEPVCRNRYRF